MIRVYLDGKFICEAVHFRIDDGRQNYATTRAFGGKAEKTPTTREPDTFVLRVMEFGDTCEACWLDGITPEMVATAEAAERADEQS